MAQEWDRVAYVSSLDDDPLRLQRLDELRRWCCHIESYDDPSYYEEGRPGPDGEWWSSVDEAIEWARARTDVVLVRVGDIHYSAGPLRAEDDADDPLPLWPPI